MWIIYWDGWQSSYRISLNNNLKLHQYWQNTVLNGSSSYSKQTSHFDSSFLLCVLWSVSYLVLAEPHCSFLTNISFSLICFLFRLIIVISRHFLEHNMRVWECQVPANIWQTHLAQIFVRQSPGQVGCCWLHCLPGHSPTWPDSSLPPPVIPAGRGLPWMLPVGSTGNIEQQVGMRAAAAAISLHRRLCLLPLAAANLSGWWWGVRIVINKPHSIPPVLSIVSSYDWGLYWIIFVVMIYKCILPADTTQNKVSWLFFERS